MHSCIPFKNTTLSNVHKLSHAYRADGRMLCHEVWLTFCLTYHAFSKLLLFSRDLLLQGATVHVTLWCRLSSCPSVPGTPPPPPVETWFLGSSGNFKQLLFSFFFTWKKFSTFTFLCISGCFMSSWVLKKIHPQFISPKIFLQWAVGEARCDTMLPSILVPLPMTC